MVCGVWCVASCVAFVFLFVLCCVVFGVWRVLFVLCVASCRDVWCVVCCVLCVVCCVLCVVCCVLRVACCVLCCRFM